MIPPSQLLEILKEVKEDIRDHPKLSLPEDLTEVLIHKYYERTQSVPTCPANFTERNYVRVPQKMNFLQHKVDNKCFG